MKPFIISTVFLVATLSANAQSNNHTDYSGTASVTQGLATTDITNLLDCGGRKAGIGTISSNDGKTWTVPAVVNYTKANFPASSDLYNECTDKAFTSAEAAVAALDGSDIINVDSTGEVYTAYIFADNYFELYINGVAVGKDNVPFTPFNSSIVRFKVKKPFTLAMKLVDWEEHLGLGSERGRGSNFFVGDGGMVAVIKDTDGNDVAITDDTWKAQTFYTSPIRNLTCISENGTARLSNGCDKSGSNDGTSYYGLHWGLPDGWQQADFDDSKWQNATTFSNQTIGVNNKRAYTNFTELFDNADNDAQFIWSTNVVLDNLVIVRKTIQ